MRWFIISTIVVLAISTLTAGYPSMPAEKQFGVKNFDSGSLTPRTEDGLIGELKIVDGYRTYSSTNGVKERPG